MIIETRTVVIWKLSMPIFMKGLFEEMSYILICQIRNEQNFHVRIRKEKRKEWNKIEKGKEDSCYSDLGSFFPDGYLYEQVIYRYTKAVHLKHIILLYTICVI